ncbi:MAG: hypothetical protein HZA78_11645 [Candidatus Schekmanbacteria bacterium]|nr:hypothetical protein [Candidatus Schekmanbacteria bacterium]
MEDILGLSSYLQIVYRRKFHFLVSFLTIISLSFVFTFTLPKIYTSSASIMVEKRGSDAVKGLFEPAPIDASKFDTMARIIKSRGKLEELVKKLSLDKTVKGPIDYEGLITRINSGLSINLGGQNLFNISFQGREPRLCMQIVNTVTGFFVEQDINAMYTTNYEDSPMLTKLLTYYEKRIDKARGALTKFQLENRDQMPGSLNKNFADLESAQLKIASIEVTIKELSGKKAKLEKALIGEFKEPIADLEQEALSPEEKKLKALNHELDNLLTTYTDKHPAVLQLKNKIELQKRILLGNQDTTSVAIEGDEAVNLQNVTYNPTYVKLRKLLDTTNEETDALYKEEQAIKDNMKAFDEKVKDAPQKEQEYAALLRELSVNQNIHQTIVKKMEKARLYKELDIMEQNIRFTVINPAQLPLNPISPKMSKNLMVGTVLGLFLGVCSAFWAEFSDHSIRDPRDLQKYIQIPLLATIPTVYTEFEAIKHKRIIILSFAAGGAYIAFLLLLIARELVITYTPSLLYFQTYRYAILHFLEALGVL